VSQVSAPARFEQDSQTDETGDDESRKVALTKAEAVVGDLKEALAVKDSEIESLGRDLAAKQELIQMYIDSASAQHDKMQAKNQELKQALEDRDSLVEKLAAEIDAMERRLAEMGSAGPEGPQPAPELAKAASVGEAQLQRLASQNHKIVTDFRQAVDRYRDGQQGFRSIVTVSRTRVQTDVRCHEDRDELLAGGGQVLGVLVLAWWWRVRSP
jgi:chromosome segregation ATPase